MLPAFLVLSIFLAALIGWVFNLIHIFTMSWGAITGELLIRVIGVPIPIIGAIAGWF